MADQTGSKGTFGWSSSAEQEPTNQNMWVLTVLWRGKKSVRARKDERFVAEVLTSPLGAVKDVSASGVCVSLGGRRRDVVRGRVMPVQLDTPNGRLEFLARVAWVRKTRQGCEAGFSLLDVKPPVAKLLRQLGKYGFVLPPSDATDPHEQPRIPPELCSVLEIRPDASDDEILHAYRRIAMAYHPDRNRSGDAAERFQQGAEAYRKIKAMRPGLLRRVRSQRP
jgi:hypothetical protein